MGYEEIESNLLLPTAATDERRRCLAIGLVYRGGREVFLTRNDPS